MCHRLGTIHPMKELKRIGLLVMPKGGRPKKNGCMYKEQWTNDEKWTHKKISK